MTAATAPLTASSQALILNVEQQAIAFRLTDPVLRFQLIEERLKSRDAERFAAYASRRASAAAQLPNATIEAQIEATCADSPILQPFAKELRSVEYEVLMDLAYPAPSGTAAYQQALAADRPVTFVSYLPTSELFVQLLLQKCGYERFAAIEHSPVGAEGPWAQQTSAATTMRPLCAMGRSPVGTNLGAHLAMGLFQEFDPQANASIAEHIGFRLIGPSVAALLHAACYVTPPVFFKGLGSAFLSTLYPKLRHPWPWLPALSEDAQSGNGLSLLPAGLHLSLIPDGHNPSALSALSVHHLQPDFLVLDPMAQWLQTAFAGPLAPVFTESAEDFLLRFSDATRGLYLPIAPDFLVALWRGFLTRPDSDCLGAILETNCMAPLSAPYSPMALLNALKNGPWPSATYTLASPRQRKILKWLAPARVHRILAFAND